MTRAPPALEHALVLWADGCRVPMLTYIGAMIAGVVVFVFLVLIFMSGWGAPGQAVPAPAGPGGGQPNPGGQTTRQVRNAALEALPDSFVAAGSATTSVSGGLTVSEQIAADTLRSEIHNGMAWLGFGDLLGGTGAAEILVTLNESGQDTVTVGRGELAAIGRDDDCTWNIEVTASTISGTVSCAAAEIWRQTIEPTGTTASIQLQFSTSLTPMEGGEVPPGEAEEDQAAD